VGVRGDGQGVRRRVRLGARVEVGDRLLRVLATRDLRLRQERQQGDRGAAGRVCLLDGVLEQVESQEALPTGEVEGGPDADRLVVGLSLPRGAPPPRTCPA
jgi:hypothetical protein